MDDPFTGPEFEALPPYPGVAPPYGAVSGPPTGGGIGGYPVQPPTPASTPKPRRAWLGAALVVGAVGLAATAFLLGRGTASRTTSVPTATALSALGQATTPSSTACGAARRAAVGTLKAVNGNTLTISGVRGGTVTVHANASTKIMKVVKGSIGDVVTGAVVSVHGKTTGTTIAADQVAILPASAAGALRPFTGGTGPMAGNLPLRGLPAGFALGSVKSVSGSTFTVTEGGTTVTVTTGSSTTFSKSQQTDLSGLTVGQPIAVTGTPNSDGSIDAANIEQAGPDGALGILGPRFGFHDGHGPRGGPGFGPGTGPGGPASGAGGPAATPGSSNNSPGTSTPPTTG